MGIGDGLGIGDSLGIGDMERMGDQMGTGDHGGPGDLLRTRDVEKQNTHLAVQIQALWDAHSQPT